MTALSLLHSINSKHQPGQNQRWRSHALTLPPMRYAPCLHSPRLSLIARSTSAMRAEVSWPKHLSSLFFATVRIWLVFTMEGRSSLDQNVHWIEFHRTGYRCHDRCRRFFIADIILDHQCRPNAGLLASPAGIPVHEPYLSPFGEAIHDKISRCASRAFSAASASSSAISS